MTLCYLIVEFLRVQKLVEIIKTMTEDKIIGASTSRAWEYLKYFYPGYGECVLSDIMTEKMRSYMRISIT